jgi:hypothetical protein
MVYGIVSRGISSSRVVVWRICAVAITVIPFVVACTTIMWQYYEKKRGMNYKVRELENELVPLSVGLHVLARLAMIVEIFLSLRLLLSGAYETVRWTNFVPHL